MSAESNGYQRCALTVFQDLIKVLQVLQDDISVFLKDGKGNEEMEVATVIIRPQPLPQTEHVGPYELALVPDKQHAEEKEEIGGVGGLQVHIELRIHELQQVVESEQLCPHARLIAQEVAFLTKSDNDVDARWATHHAVHELDKAPESNRIVLHDSVDRGEEVAHALHIAKILIVLVVRE